MEQKTVLLLNVVIIQLISIFSDYWISIKFRSISPPNCHFRQSRQLTVLECANSSYALVRQHANLFRQCNDMSEGYRQNLSRSGALYSDSCHWFLTDWKYSWRNRVQANFSSDLFSLVSSLASPFLGLIGYFLSKSAKGVIRALSIATFTSLIPVVNTMYIIHSTNIREPKTEEQFLYYTESDWSLFCAALGSFLSLWRFANSMISIFTVGLTTHICMVEHRHSLGRLLSQRRRRQLHNALMSSCRQDIAMAIRARMTVI